MDFSFIAFAPLFIPANCTQATPCQNSLSTILLIRNLVEEVTTYDNNLIFRFIRINPDHMDRSFLFLKSS
ncbi:BgTH12-07748 [Blumeria graminis f. sp. triticale]|uniref:Bgt-5153 n=3 Tax=Blumeria graminis TaxID=34373 RepID=A0A061HD78_BLUGR|nr:Ubiquitin-specific protease [Blumeria graminis f. sp. tritici 96224]CAD6506521.1 BgTH12-07748 [Blumeria graminis f. sp. triticale]VDB96375.1 Bgt-5153 [Blumeria graminis f. sp. tritici]